MLVGKRQTDVSAIENKVLSMYAKGLSQRDMADTIEEIYGFNISHEMIPPNNEKCAGGVGSTAEPTA